MSRTGFDRRDLLVIAVGGLIGAAVRHWVTDVDAPTGGWFAYDPNSTVVAEPSTDAIPWRTLTVNLAGCLMLGAVLAIRNRTTHRPSRLGLAIGTGFCGSLTTFSTFAVEVAQRLANRVPTGHVTARNGAIVTEGLTPVASGLAYVALSLAGGAAAFWAGRTVGGGTQAGSGADPAAPAP